MPAGHVACFGHSGGHVCRAESLLLPLASRLWLLIPWAQAVIMIGDPMNLKHLLAQEPVTKQRSRSCSLTCGEVSMHSVPFPHSLAGAMG